MSHATADQDLRRNLKVRMRPDLDVTKHVYGGQTYYIVRDPVSLRYFRFRPEEMFLVRQLDGKRTLEDVRQEFVAEFRPQRLSIADLEKFVRQLLHAGVAAVDSSQVGRRLFERFKQRRRDKLKQTFLSLMYLKVPVFDPERILDALLPWTRFLYTLPFFFFACAFWLSAGMLVLMNWTQFLAKLPSFEDFFHFERLIWLWAAIGVIKVIHEFSHGLSCKRFGGEVHEMGLMLLVFSPALYCNVTDAWMLPNKWHRAVIGAAGIYVELIIAAAAVWIWWFSEPGFLNYMCLSIIFVCSVSTVMFNGNPLMRFDGYYILSDVIEIPNLRERSNKYVGNLASLAVLGAEANPDAYAPAKHRWAFALYAIGAFIYRWVVSVGILVFLYRFLKPYNLQIVGVALAWVTLGSMAVMPLYSISRTLRQRWKEMKVKTLRMTVGLAVAGSLIAVAVLVPFPYRVDLPLILQARGATTVYVKMAGQLDRLMVQDGEHVQGGAILAVLQDPESEKELRRLELERDKDQQRVLAAQSIDDAAGAAEAGERFRGALEQIRQVEDNRGRLLLRAPAGVSGVVLTPPRDVDLGNTLKPGVTFCRIGDPTSLEAYVVVEHSDTSLVKPGARAWVKLNGQVGEIAESSVERISENVLEDLPPALSNKIEGGKVATTAEHSGEQPSEAEKQNRREAPMMRSYSLIVPVDNRDGALRPGMRGVLRVDAGSKSLAWRFTRYLRQTFYFKM